ncbi:MAG: Spy/CpxP family protein refolding chaperone [Pyrinomonadaceae bacterium]|nr:Spy/CpxP family protein refolding chaperone [Pyrinomonadaceae bacterium]
MKKVAIGIVAFVVVAISAILVIGQFRGSDGERGFGKRGEGRHTGGMMLRGLNLSDEQKAQFEQIRSAHQEAAAPLHEAMKANREKLNAATANGAFDEAAVTAIANEHGSIAAQMLVAREKMKSQVFGILNDEQKAKFAEMQKDGKGGFGSMKGHRGGGKRRGMTEAPAEQPAN